MPRETVSKFHLVDIPIKKANGSHTVIEIQVYYKKAGSSPGHFLIEPEMVIIDDQKIPVPQLKHTDVKELCERIRKSVEQHITEEKLNFCLYVKTTEPEYIEVPSVYQVVNYDRPLPSLNHLYLATGSDGSVFKTESKEGSKRRLVFLDELDYIKRNYTKVDDEERYAQLKTELGDVADAAKGMLFNCHKEQYEKEVKAKWKEFCNSLTPTPTTATTSDQDLSTILQAYSK
jgi:hypothetical protein